MATSIDIKIRQDFLRLKTLASPPETDEDGCLFLNELDGKPKFKEPYNGKTYNLVTRPYVGKLLTYDSNGDSNGLSYYCGINFGSTPWRNPTETYNSMYVAYSSVTENVDYSNPTTITNRAEGCFATSDYPDSQVGISITAFEKIQLSGIYLKSPNIDSFGFLQSFNLVGVDTKYQETILHSTLNDLRLVGINNDLFIPISPISKPLSSVMIRQTGLSSNGTNVLAIGQMELYGLFI